MSKVSRSSALRESRAEVREVGNQAASSQSTAEVREVDSQDASSQNNLAPEARLMSWRLILVIMRMKKPEGLMNKGCFLINMNLDKVIICFLILRNRKI